MSQEPVSNKALKDFVDVFLRAADSGDDLDSKIWGQVEELARRAIRQTEFLRRPHDINPLDWDKARECMDFAAHSVVEQDNAGVDVTHVLGFLPIVADTMSGAIDSMASTWNMAKLSKAMQYKYEYALRLHPLWISHDTLADADARDIQSLLQALLAGSPPDAMWHKPENMACEHMCVRVFYMPVVYTVHGTMEPKWSPEDVYAPCDFNSQGESAVMEAFEDTFSLHGDQDTRFQLYDIGLADQVTYEARTRRDLREVDTRLEMMKANVALREKPEHEVHLEIQLTWGAGLGDAIEPGEAPVIRFVAIARNFEDNVPQRMVTTVHVDPESPESWGESLQHLLSICYRVGWPNVQVKQVSGTQALNYWSEANAPTQLM